NGLPSLIVSKSQSAVAVCCSRGTIAELDRQRQAWRSARAGYRRAASFLSRVGRFASRRPGAGKGAPTQLALEPMGGRSCFGCVIPRRGLVIARLAILYRLVQAALGSLAALCH